MCPLFWGPGALHGHIVFRGACAMQFSFGKTRLWLIGIPVRAQHPAAKCSRCPRRTASQGRPPSPLTWPPSQPDAIPTNIAAAMHHTSSCILTPLLAALTVSGLVIPRTNCACDSARWVPCGTSCTCICDSTSSCLLQDSLQVPKCITKRICCWGSDST